MTRRYDMMISETRPPLLTLYDLARRCGLHPELVERLVQLGVVEPEDNTSKQFRPEMAYRLQRCLRLRHDFGLSYHATALVSDLLERIEHLEARLRYLEQRR